MGKIQIQVDCPYCGSDYVNNWGGTASGGAYFRCGDCRIEYTVKVVDGRLTVITPLMAVKKRRDDNIPDPLNHPNRH